MDKMLDLYRAVAELDTGFWIAVPVATGQLVSRDEWTKLMHEAVYLGRARLCSSVKPQLDIV